VSVMLCVLCVCVCCVYVVCVVCMCVCCVYVVCVVCMCMLCIFMCYFIGFSGRFEERNPHEISQRHESLCIPS